MRALIFLGLLASLHGLGNIFPSTDQAANEELARSVLSAVTGVLVNALFENPPDLESEFTTISFLFL